MEDGDGSSFKDTSSKNTPHWNELLLCSSDVDNALRCEDDNDVDDAVAPVAVNSATSFVINSESASDSSRIRTTSPGFSP